MLLVNQEEPLTVYNPLKNINILTWNLPFLKYKIKGNRNEGKHSKHYANEACMINLHSVKDL